MDRAYEERIGKKGLVSVGGAKLNRAEKRDQASLGQLKTSASRD